jgi:hypothetical protein
VLCGDYVTLVRSASNKLTGNIVKITNGVHTSSQPSPGSLNCRDIEKEQLTERLYTAIYLLNQRSLPLVGLAVEQNGQLEKLKDEKITDQDKIMELRTSK